MSKPWWQWEHAAGDWGGARTELEKRGVILEGTYTGEVFSNLRGGINTSNATEYRGNLDITVTLGSEPLGRWRGGTVFLYFQNGHGSGITDRHVGDTQRLSNIDAGDFTQLSEYWLEQGLYGNRVRFKLGKQDANTEFCALDHGVDFLHSSFGVIPTMPLPTFPDPALGAALFVEPLHGIAFGTGIYDGDANGGTSGFDSAFDRRGGTFTVAEITLRTSLLGAAPPLGSYRAGFWYHSANTEEITRGSEPQTFSGNHGLYLAFDQLLLAGRAATDEPGLGAFAQLGWAPDDRNELGWYVGGGLIYAGTHVGRGRDVLGVGVAHARFGARVRRLDGRSHETALEVFYQAEITPWLTLQPDVQFIANPGGDGRDAVVAGLRVAVDL